MQGLLKFTDYEVFAYLIAGLALMIGADLVLGWEIVLRRDGSLSLTEGLVRLLIAYVLGFLLDDISYWFLQRVVGGRIIGHPFSFLLSAAGKRPPGWRGWPPMSWLVGGYLEPAPEPIRSPVIKKLQEDPSPWSRDDVDTIQAPPRGLVTAPWWDLAEEVFSRAQPAATRDAIAQARMELFLKHYGFARNLGFVLLLCTLGFFVQCCRGEGVPQLGRAPESAKPATVVIVPADSTAARVAAVLKEAPAKGCEPFGPAGKPAVAGCGALLPHGWMALAFGLFAGVMILRFLHFHRLYALALLTGYARAESKPPATDSIAVARAKFLAAVAAARGK